MSHNTATLLSSMALLSQGMDNYYNIPTVIQESPIYYPKKHTISTYRAQQRAAKSKRRIR